MFLTKVENTIVIAPTNNDTNLLAMRSNYHGRTKSKRRCNNLQKLSSGRALGSDYVPALIKTSSQVASFKLAAVTCVKSSYYILSGTPQLKQPKI